MGFFASRWIEKHGAETEKAALTSPVPVVAQAKGKWYARKKDAESPGRPTGNGTTKLSLSTTEMSVHGENGFTLASPNGKNSGSFGTWGASSINSPISPHDGPSKGYPAPRKGSIGGISSPSPLSRPVTDAVTVTLAQKLEELATANSDGLLSDDEYRVLRQNLFERFGSVAAKIPVEQSSIVLPSPSSRHSISPNVDRSTTTPTAPHGASNFTVSRSRSIRSNHSHTSSVQTAITSLIRKATRRLSTPRTSIAVGENDAESTYSRGSRNGSTFPRGLPRTLVHKASSGSIQTSPSIMGGASGGRNAYDVRSIASRRTTRSGKDNATMISRTTTRSRPPSSYHRRQPPSETGASDEIGADWTAAELRAEILSLEGESKRVMDMFNGLEMSAVTKYHPAHPGLAISDSPGGSGSRSDLAGLPLPRKSSTQEKSSRMSLSSTSMRNFAGGLQRKGSLSFLSGKRSQALPPLPPLPTSATSLSTVFPPSSSSPSSLHPMAISSQSNRSSPNLTLERSGSQTKLSRSRSGYLGTNIGRDGGAGLSGLGGEDQDPEQVALEKGLEDIRQKRASVILRYDKRLEYLRARLRSAELHERLLK